MASLEQEIARRRTFAIISHPDAGKTTLTEKLLLYGGAVQMAGSVRARKGQRATTSDWMELERQRGISISSTLLQFDYSGYRVNLLDTPGHKDFSEDTYRVLTAVDAAVMVIDAGKGIESQTRKLFEVCARRGIPIFTFMNKLDRPAKDPLELLDELERVLGIGACAMNWPLGDGAAFRGVYDRQTRELHLFEKVPSGKYAAPVETAGLDDPRVREQVDARVYERVTGEIAMIEGAGHEFDAAAVLAGRQTPVFFGSGVNNFGVQLLLDNFLRYSSPPTPRRSTDKSGAERLVQPADAAFSGFVFKIQANMDPNHRDRIAFVRVVSGRFERESAVTHVQSGKKVRISNAHKLFGRERETIDDAVAGDVIGIVGGAEYGIGDTLTTDPSIRFAEIPRFSPECFALLHNPQTAKYKQFRDGLRQLLQEGVVQSYELVDSLAKIPLLAAVGPLQFEVLQYRLQTEYNAESRLENKPWRLARWWRVKAGQDVAATVWPTGSAQAIDPDGGKLLLLAEDWQLDYFAERNPHVELSVVPFGA
ncbi:MAG: peptide chain release factor 3 [Planctomycetota bacterium]|nr:MAG: peptide chain release factor 3 [Planctomycetota bacterium]